MRRKRYVVAASAMYMCSGGAPYPLRRFDAYENMMVSVAPAHKSSRLGGVGRMPPPRLPRYPRRTKRPSRLLTARGVSQTRARAPSQLSREHAGRPPRRSSSSSSRSFSSHPPSHLTTIIHSHIPFCLPLSPLYLSVSHLSHLSHQHHQHVRLLRGLHSVGMGVIVASPARPQPQSEMTFRQSR